MLLITIVILQRKNNNVKQFYKKINETKEKSKLLTTAKQSSIIVKDARKIGQKEHIYEKIGRKSSNCRSYLH